jgi:hypothetical protein
LLANNSWNTYCYFVWNTNCNSLANLDGLLLTHWNANCVRNFLSNGFACPVANGVVASTSFSNHGALAYTYVFGSLLANPIAGLVANGSSTALRNHLASCIVNCLAMAFRNHFACCVANGLLTAFWNHLASGVGYNLAVWLADIAANSVVTSLLTALWNLSACCVADSLLSALRNHLANSVRNFFRYAALLVTNAVDFLSFAGWNPNLLANCLWWALNAFNVAATRNINALAL